GVSMTNLAEMLGLDKSSASRRANDAIERGYLKNLEEKKRRPARLVIGDPLPDAVEGLPAVEKMRGGGCRGGAVRGGDRTPPLPCGRRGREGGAGMDALTLLLRARDVGLRVEAAGGKLMVRGPKRAEAVVRLLAEHKAEVLAALTPRPAAAFPSYWK